MWPQSANGQHMWMQHTTKLPMWFVNGQYNKTAECPHSLPLATYGVGRTDRMVVSNHDSQTSGSIDEIRRAVPDRRHKASELTLWYILTTRLLTLVIQQSYQARTANIYTTQPYHPQHTNIIQHKHTTHNDSVIRWASNDDGIKYLIKEYIESTQVIHTNIYTTETLTYGQQYSNSHMTPTVQ